MINEILMGAFSLAFLGTLCYLIGLSISLIIKERKYTVGDLFALGFASIVILILILMLCWILGFTVLNWGEIF